MSSRFPHFDYTPQIHALGDRLMEEGEVEVEQFLEAIHGGVDRVLDGVEPTLLTLDELSAITHSVADVAFHQGVACERLRARRQADISAYVVAVELNDSIRRMDHDSSDGDGWRGNH